MKIFSFNINGIKAHIHQLIYILKFYKPDIICLQETRISDEYFPKKEISFYGYNSYFVGEKKYNGVAILSLEKANYISKYLNKNNFLNKSRVIICNFFIKNILIEIINIYSPHGNNINDLIKFNNKKNFFLELERYIKIKLNKNSNLLVIGDFNICPTNLDIGIDKKYEKIWIKYGRCAFLPEEKKIMKNIFKCGLIDILRKQKPNYNKFSWFSYSNNNFLKNKGLRIDFILSTNNLFKLCNLSGIDYKIRSMNSTSDHVPIWSIFDI